MTLTPVYAYNAPREPIRLHDGVAGGLAEHDVHTVVELLTTGALQLAWRAELPGGWRSAADRSPAVMLRRPMGDAELRVRCRNDATGWTNGGEIGDVGATVDRVVAHWFNLADIGPAWSTELGEWRVVIEPRPDLTEVLSDVHLDRVFVMTHVLQIRRVDGAEFTADDVHHILEALHLGVSFGLGRWAAPMLPVGLNRRDEVLWERWRTFHCGQAVNIESGWWHEQQDVDLAELLTNLVGEFADPDRRAALRLQLQMAITCTTAEGFTEQRIMIGGSGLEHVMWQTLVLGGQMTKQQYKAPGAKAHNHLRRVLIDAGIAVDIDPAVHPTLAQFAAREQVRQGRQARPFDGPEIAMQVRNRIVHPEDKQERIYEQHDLVTEVWCLIRHYLSLLILRSIGYKGTYRDLRVLDGSVWDGIESVPWS